MIERLRQYKTNGRKRLSILKLKIAIRWHKLMLWRYQKEVDLLIWLKPTLKIESESDDNE